jgi:septal ring factor EnvC (AmiA/AmiB activator)
LVAGGLLAATPLAVHSVTEEEIEAAERAKAEKEQEARDTQALAAASEARAGALQQQLAVIDRDRYAAVERLRDVQRELETLELEVFDINESIGRLNRRLSGETVQLERNVRSLYKAGRTTALEAALSAESFSDALDRAAALERVLAQDVADIDRLRSSRREVQLRTADLRGRLDQMETLRAEAAAIETELAKRSDEQQDLIFGVQQTQASLEDQRAAFEGEAAVIAGRIALLRDIRQRELAELERRRRIQEQQAQLQEIARQVAQEQGATAAGPYIWPMLGLITTEFGGCTFGQCPHIGIDIAASMGSPIAAANDGVVLAAGLVVPGNRRASYGMIVVIAHSDSEETLYAHLDDLNWPPPVTPGQFVSRGQTIGFVGLTGWTTGPHLHFEYRVNGVPQSPRSVLIG